MTFNLYAYQPNGWIGGWTIMYWAWWISWSPFVGMFIARVSRGRTIREFIIGVLLIPTGFTIICMGFLGNTALFSILQEHNTTLIQAVQNDSSVALFEFLNHLPFSTVMSLLATVLVMLFFVTSADSGALVTDYLTAKTENSPTWQRLFWTGGWRCSQLLSGGSAFRGRWSELWCDGLDSGRLDSGHYWPIWTSSLFPEYCQNHKLFIKCLSFKQLKQRFWLIQGRCFGLSA